MPVCTPFLTQGFTLISHSCLYNGRFYSNRSKTRYLPLLHSRIVHVCHLPGPIAKCVSAIDFQIANKCKILENPASDASPLFYFAPCKSKARHNASQSTRSNAFDKSRPMLHIGFLANNVLSMIEIAFNKRASIRRFEAVWFYRLRLYSVSLVRPNTR